MANYRPETQLLSSACGKLSQKLGPLSRNLSDFNECCETWTGLVNKPLEDQFSSVQFSPLTYWVVGGTWGTIQHRPFSSLFRRRPLWAVLAWAGMSTLWCCPSSISFADHGVAHLPRCPEGWFCSGCRGVWHAQIMQISASWQLAEEVLVDPQGSWSCSSPSRWPCAPWKKCRGDKLVWGSFLL